MGGISAVLYDNSNGLPTSEANAIAQTQNGFIWIGGYSGLVRYDRNDFYRFDSSLGITSVMSLYVDDGDRIWIGTNDSGAVLYDNCHLNIDKDSLCEVLLKYHLRTIKSCVCKFAS